MASGDTTLVWSLLYRWKMPALANPKHERFAQEVVKGSSASAAYRTVYDVKKGNAADASASRLLKSDKVAARVAELQERKSDDVMLSAQWVIEQLIDNATKAKMQGDFGPSNQALQLLGKELGMFVERTENVNLNHDISPEPLTETEWAEQHATSH
jgi:hypothetical protein